MIENEVIPGFNLSFFKLIGFLVLGLLVIIFDRQIRIRGRNRFYFFVVAVFALGLGMLIGYFALHPNPILILLFFSCSIVLVVIARSLME